MMINALFYIFISFCLNANQYTKCNILKTRIMFMIVIAEEKKLITKMKKKMRKSDVQQSVNQIYLKFKT